MVGWLTSNKMKKHQRRMNYFVRQVNYNIIQDSLWQGRFYIRQYGATFKHTYLDGSGSVLIVKFRLYDKKTGAIAETFYDTVNAWCMFSGIRLFEIMNKFIVEVEGNFQYNCSGPHLEYIKKPN